MHAVWYLDLGLLMHFNMVAASHCSLQLLFSISFERGQGSAAGAAEDHTTCMLDALKCMGLMVRFGEDCHHLLCAIWYFRMLFL